MKHMLRAVAFTSLAVAVVLMAPSGWSQQSESAAAAPKSIHIVKSGELTLRVEREGRIESAAKSRVRLLPREFKGGFEVAEVLRRSGRVTRGDVLLKLDGEALENEITSAQMASDHARRKLEIAREEQRLLAESNATKREQAQKNRANAEKELMIWEKYDSPGMLKSAELNLRQREFGLADQKQELEQLEAMYSGTHLASETKDIVLERARRGVKMSEAWLTLAINTELVTREYRHSMQDRNVRDGLRIAAQDEAHTAINTSAAEQRKSMEIEAAERALADAEQRLAKLAQDRELLTVVAPADGLMTRIEVEPRDVINARQPICEIVNPAQLQVKFNLTAEDLRVIQPQGAQAPTDSSLVLQLVEYPEITLNGTIDELAEIGTAAEKATHFPLTVKVTSADPAIRIGMRCTLLAGRTLNDVLTIPASAVKWHNGEARCTVQSPQGTQERIITLGASSGDRVIVTAGLAPNDQVVMPEVKGE